MEFLVEIDTHLPDDLEGERRAELQAAEFARATDLAEAGTIRAMWRIPGRLANCGVWSAPDATTLHNAISSLPFWPYMDARVTALGRHPLGPHCQGLSAGLEVDSEASS
jgi:muconolactone D-isomerase